MHLQSSNSPNSFCYNKKMKYLTTLFLLGLLRATQSLRISSQDHLDEEPYEKYFGKYDADKDGSLSFSEFKKFVKRGGGSEEDAELAMKNLDTDTDDKVSLDEFKNVGSLPHEDPETQETQETFPEQSTEATAPAAETTETQPSAS